MVFECVTLLEGPDCGISVPQGSVNLVAAHMPVFVGEKSGHLADKFVDEPIGLFPGGIERNAITTKVMFEHIRARRAGKLRIANKPGVSVSGHIEFRHDTNASVTRVGDDLSNLRLRVVKTIRSQLVQKWERSAFHAKALVVRQMPMENIQFHNRHGVESALDNLDRLPVPRDVNHEPAPCEARPIVDVNDGQEEAIMVSVEKL